MANGCVIVTTDHGGIKDIVNEGYGVFVEKNSPNSVVEGIEKAMINYLKKSEFAWTIASSKYKMSDFAKRVESTLNHSMKKG
jgi:glycosyltransferase involved in cell wall biosynthesis